MKEVSVILLSSVKFAMIFPLAILEYKMGILKTMLLTNLGGLLGIFFFSYIADILIHLWKKHISIHIRKYREKRGYNPKKKKIFTRKNRRIINIRSKYGLIGIAFATPVILSIPLGTFLIVRYFGKKPATLSWLAAANLVWSFIYVIFYTFLYEFYLEIFATV